jgi:hypothetical protein
MPRPPQNLNLIDYALAEAERVFIGVRFLLRERLQESRRRKISQFIALTKIIPLRTHVKISLRTSMPGLQRRKSAAPKPSAAS